MAPLKFRKSMPHYFRPHFGAQGSLLLIHHEVLANSPKCDPRVIMAVDFKGTFDASTQLRNEALALAFCSPLC